MKIEITKKTKYLFVAILVSSLSLALIAQLYLVNVELYSVTLLSCLTNLIICVASFYTLANMSKKDASNVGYIFLIFSMLKFGTYFLGFRFYFQIDDVVTKEEYSVFFVPYLLAILVEIVFLIKELNGAEMDPSKFVVIEDELEESLSDEEEE